MPLAKQTMDANLTLVTIAAITFFILLVIALYDRHRLQNKVKEQSETISIYRKLLLHAEQGLHFFNNILKGK